MFNADVHSHPKETSYKAKGFMNTAENGNIIENITLMKDYKINADHLAYFQT